jgi:hypothetical protein
VIARVMRVARAAWTLLLGQAPCWRAVLAGVLSP